MMSNSTLLYRFFTLSVVVCTACVFIGCQSSNEPKLPAQFRLLEASETGIDFANTLKADSKLNIFNYMYFYNGSGVGAGDFNNDGLTDLCFTGNLSENKLYLNRGKMKFEDVSAQTNINQNKAWANGVSVVDINQDGKLDIYISQVGGIPSLDGRNLLFVCKEITAKGIPVYEEKAKEYGLDLKGLGTQAAFFDYDLDGDLDFFQLNHSVHQNGTFGFRSAFQGTPHPTAGDKFFRNDNGKFIDVTQQVHIIDDVLGYGLGVGIGDVNLDGYPDMYIGNDFHENDYLYLNQRNGSFTESSERQIMHTSQFSMGIDIGDLNNDLLPEIISLDMLPNDKEILKRSEGEDSYNIFKYKIRQGYSYQFARNNLQLNRNGVFSEMGMYAGVHATDWSWSPLMMDFDNDGKKDIFISNGIPKRMNDIDYIQFVSDEAIQQKMNKGEFNEDDPDVVDILPEIKLPNKFYHNTQNLQFTDWQNAIENDKPSFSNGAIYADLDNDGDLDVIANNINDKAFIYENLSTANESITLQVEGNTGNRNAIGAKCLVFRQGEVISYEKFPVRGFQSSAEIPLVVGVGKIAEVDSLLLVWPNQTYQVLHKSELKKQLKLVQSEKLPRFDYQRLQKLVTPKVTFEDKTTAWALDFVHQENNFNELDREALIPHLASSAGPAVAVADINHDGLEDIFLGNARDALSKVYLQNANGKFQNLPQPALEKDLIYEDVDAQWTDVDSDKHLDLVVASGGNEFFGRTYQLQPRVYLNNGRGQLTRKEDAFKDLYVTASCVRAFDFTGDGAVDLFIGGRSIPKAYGDNPTSYLLVNDGKGNFTDKTTQLAPELRTIGMVTNAELVDLNKDQRLDLLLSIEWKSLTVFHQNNGRFEKAITIGSNQKGWWNFTLTYDFDQDGDVDILAGNLGLNSRIKASKKEPVRLYVGDIDKNDRVDQILTYYLNGEETLFANKMETEKQFPYIKKEYIHARDFAKTSVENLFGKDKLGKMAVLEANEFANGVFVNDGKGNFQFQPLPYLAQLSPYKTAAIIDANGDNLPDVFLGGNFYDNNIQMGRYDADFGTILLNKGKNQFEIQLSKIPVYGQVRHIKPFKNSAGKIQWLLAKNNDRPQILSIIPPTSRKF